MLLIKNGVLATMDPARPAASAAVVEDGRFTFVGEGAEAEDYVRRSGRGPAETLDLEGAFLMPGFNDSHMHFIHYVRTKLTVDLFGADSLAEVGRRLRRGLDLPGGGAERWLVGEGWNQELFTDEKRFPTRRDLDRMCPERPVLILRSCFHIGVLNTRGLELLGLNRETAEQHGSFVEREEDGAPNGIIKENLLDDIKAGLPAPDLPEMLELTVRAQEDLFSQGLTSVQSDDFKYAPPECGPYALMAGLRELADAGRLKLRIAEQALLTEPETMEEFFIREGEWSGGDERFRVSTVKILADGSLGGRTAYLRAPYADAPEERGLPIYRDQAELDRLVLAAHRRNMPAAIHAIGDGAAEMALRAIANARQAEPRFKPRHGLVHCQVMGEEQLRQMKELDVTAYVQPVFLSSDMHIAPQRLGAERLAGAYAWRSMIEAGIRTSFGTDCPVEHFRPLDGVYCAVTRRDLSGRGPFLPEQAIPVEQALAAYTVGSAAASGEETYKGQIRPGMLADFIVADRNLLTCPPEELLTARILRTYVGGHCVFQR